MRKLLTLFAAIAVFSVSFATSVIEIKPVLRADQIFIPTSKTGEKISLMELSRIKIKDFEVLKGQKMKFIERLTFKVAQKKLRDNIAPDGSFDTKRMEKAFKKHQRSGKNGFHLGGDFHFGGFLLGFFLGPIGILITYIVSDDYNRDRRWSAWKGFFAATAIALAIIAASGGY